METNTTTKSLPAKSPFREVLETVPEESRSIVGLHANYLLNTQGGRPSDAARSAVAAFNRLGPAEFDRMHYADLERTMRGCCPTCRADADKRWGPAR